MKKILALLLCALLIASPSWAAFPTIEDSTTSETSADTAIVVTLPTTISAGQLILVFIGADEGGSFDWTPATGFTEIYDQSIVDGCHLTVGYKVAAGTEGGTTITVTNSVATRSTHHSYAISGHDSGQPPQASAEASGTSTNADPPSLTPTGGAKDYLWFATACIDSGTNITAAPSSYTNLVFTEHSGGLDAGLATARRELNAASEDPGTFTNGSDDWDAATIAVHPAVATAKKIVPSVVY